MKLKTVIELLTLSSSLYALSKDEKLMAEVQKLGEKGKENLDKLLNEIPKEYYDEYEVDPDQRPVGEILQKAMAIKKELDERLEELVEKAYGKMHITHTKEIEVLRREIEELKTHLDDKEERIKNLENNSVK